MAVNRWMGFWQVLNMTKTAINDMKQHIQELDTVMTSISVVTNFSQEDLWGQISQYSEIARQYGVAIKGVYEVSQIYYQQGLQQNDVMTLTTETLKMARIAGLDYATAADYMTTAIRGFKLEMTDAAHVTDVFSALAATTASSTEEIATAISKTAASAEAVGASFEATSAMMATMISTTRESATNIGTALKSVISRYGEMTGDPSKTVDSEGEEMSLNRVDKALQTVGITIHDTAGQFRDFDDVMLELMEKWDSLDSLSQRYIATLMAGNRQQSRFLALVSNVDEYKKALETAMDSEGTGELQTLKTLDSIDAKIEKMKVTIQEFYTSSGLEKLYKSVLDGITNIVSAANSLPKIFDNFPAIALSIGASLISSIKSIITLFINSIVTGLERVKGENMTFLEALVDIWRQGGKRSSEAYVDAATQEMANGQSKIQNNSGGISTSKWFNKLSSKAALAARYGGAILSTAGSLATIAGLNKYGVSTSVSQDQEAGAWSLGGSLASIGGGALRGFATGGLAGAALGGLSTLVTQIPNIASAVSMINVNTARRVQLAEKAATEAKTTASKQQAETQELEKAVNTYKELESNMYSSAEAMQEYKDHMNTVADAYPALISRMDESGNYIVELETLEAALAAARQKSAIATAQAAQAELNANKEELEAYKKTRDEINQKYTKNDYQEELSQEYQKSSSPEQLFRVLSYNPELSSIVFDAGRHEAMHSDYASYLKIYNNGVDTSQQLNFTENNAKEVFEQNFEALRQYYGNLLAQVSAHDPADVKSDLNKQIKTLQKIDSSLSLEYLTGIAGIENLNDLEPEQLYYAIAHLQEVANQQINNQADIVDNTAKTLVLDRSQVAITKADTEDLSEQFDYNKHGQLISGLVSQNKWLQEWAAIDTEESDTFETLTEQKTNEYLKYFKTRKKGLDFLENELHLRSFSTKEDLEKVLQKEGQLSNDAVGTEIRTAYINTWTEQRKTIVKAYHDQLLQIFKDKELIPSFLDTKFDQSSGLDNGRFTEDTLTVIQSNLSRYQTLIDKQQYAQAEAYLHNMEEIYGKNGIGGLSEENQTKAYSIIKDLDFSDPEALRSAAETFAEMDIDFSGVSNQFMNAALRWTTSAATLLEQLVSSAKDTAKSIESSTSDMSKVFKYSEALEKAQAIMDANEGVKFDELFTFDKDLGGYIKSAKAFQLEMAAFQNEQFGAINQSIEDYGKIEDIRQLYSNSLQQSYSKSKTLASPEAIQKEQTMLKSNFATTLGLKDSTEIDRLWQEYTSMVDAYEEQLKTNEDLSWEDFAAEYLNNQTTALKESLDKIKEMPQQMAREELQSFNYASIVSGKGTAQTKETLKALIQASLKDGAQFDFNTFWTNLITGQIDNANEALAKADLGQISKGQADRARFDSLKSLYNTLIDENPVWAVLDDTQRKLLESVGIGEKEYKTDGVSSAVTAVWAALTGLTDGVIANLDELRGEIAKNADSNFKKSNAGKQKDLLDKYKDGFTSDELAELQGNTDLLLDKNGNLTELAEKYLELDENTGDFIVKAGLDAASVIQYLAQSLGIAINTTTDQYKDTIQASINEEITKLDNADIDKQRASQISALGNAKVGDRLNVSLLSSATQKRLAEAGLDITNGILTVTSEEALNNGILALKDKLTQGHWAERHPIEAREIESIISTLESRMNKMTGLSGIISESVTKDAAEAFALAFEGTTEKAPEIMERMGAVWNDLSQTWIIDEDDLGEIESYIQELEALDTTGANATAISQMRAQIENLRDSFARRPAQALNDILTNYTNVSNDMIATFDQYWLDKVDISEYIISIDEVTGNKKIDIVGLKQALAEAGEEVEELFNEAIAQVTDELLGQLSTGVSFQISGTNNFTEMQNFVDNINEKLESNFTINDLFGYNTALDNFTLNTTAFNNYKKALEKELQDLHWSQDLIDEYIKDQTDVVIQQSIELDGFLNADTSRARNNEANKLIQQIRGLSNYAKIATSAFGSYDKQYKALYGKKIEEIQVREAQTILRVLESGGQNETQPKR